MKEFLIGVISSISASVLTLVAKYHVIPIVQGMLWNITDISGEWIVYFDDPSHSEPVGRVTIKQRGARITMSFHRHRDRAGKPTNTIFSYKGVFRAAQLAVLWEATDQRDSRIGALVLHLSYEGDEFKGLTTFYDTDLGRLNILPYWLRRPP